MSNNTFVKIALYPSKMIGDITRAYALKQYFKKRKISPHVQKFLSFSGKIKEHYRNLI